MEFGEAEVVGGNFKVTWQLHHFTPFTISYGTLNGGLIRKPWNISCISNGLCKGSFSTPKIASKVEDSSILGTWNSWVTIGVLLVDPPFLDLGLKTTLAKGEYISTHPFLRMSCFLFPPFLQLSFESELWKKKVLQIYRTCIYMYIYRVCRYIIYIYIIYIFRKRCLFVSSCVGVDHPN